MKIPISLTITYRKSSIFFYILTILLVGVSVGMYGRSIRHKFNSEKTDDINLTLLISDGGLNAQIIQCTDSTVIHGFGYVYPYEFLYNEDIEWEPNFEIDGIIYPIVERRLKVDEIKKFKEILSKINAYTLKDPYVIYDDYRYVLYVNNKKVATAFYSSLELDGFPSRFRKIIMDILSIGGPLYPNYGIAN